MSAFNDPKPVLVVYATRHGQAQKVAERAAGQLATLGSAADVIDARRIPEGLEFERYGGAVLVASVHVGRHEAEIVDFVRKHRGDLSRIPTALLSLSMAEASVENTAGSPAQRIGAKEQVDKMIHAFLAQTDFQPSRILPVAGALLYTHYNPIVRFVMRCIAQTTGGPTDTSRDYQFTDFHAIERFVTEFWESLGGQRVGAPAPAELSSSTAPMLGHHGMP